MFLVNYIATNLLQYTALQFPSNKAWPHSKIEKLYLSDAVKLITLAWDFTVPFCQLV